METNQEKSLVKADIYSSEDKAENYNMEDFRAQTQDYGQKLQEAAVKAKDYAAEKFGQVSDKIKELDGKDPQELLEEAKQYARQKPGQALLVSAAVGLVLGLLLKGRK